MAGFFASFKSGNWDHSLTAASERRQPVFILLILLLARFGGGWPRYPVDVDVDRSLLSSFLSRQMEFDADLYEIRMCGSESFVVIQRRLHQLQLGAALAQKQMIQQWKQEKKLFDQIPSLIVQLASEIPAEIQSRHHSARDQVRTRLFDSHPSDAERIQRAVAASEPGIFHATTPATQLFTDFTALARRVTLGHYRELVGRALSEQALVSTEQSARRAEHDRSADEQIVERYFLGVPSALRPIFVAENKTMAVRQPEPLIAAILSNRATMERLLPEAQTAYGGLHEADSGGYFKPARPRNCFAPAFNSNPPISSLPPTTRSWVRLRPNARFKPRTPRSSPLRKPAAHASRTPCNCCFCVSPRR